MFSAKFKQICSDLLPRKWWWNSRFQRLSGLLVSVVFAHTIIGHHLLNVHWPTFQAKIAYPGLSVCTWLSIPRCLLWIWRNISALMLFGTIRRVSLKRSPSTAATLSRNDQWGLASVGTCCLVSGHLFVTMVRTACNSASSLVSFLNSSYRSSETERTRFIYWKASYPSFSALGTAALLRVSATICLFQGMYRTSTS